MGTGGAITVMGKTLYIENKNNHLAWVIFSRLNVSQNQKKGFEKCSGVFTLWGFDPKGYQEKNKDLLFF